MRLKKLLSAYSKNSNYEQRKDQIKQSAGYSKFLKLKEGHQK